MIIGILSTPHPSPICAPSVSLEDLIPDVPITGVMSMLRPGWDQQLAQLLQDQGVPVHALIPCDNYADSFEYTEDLVLMTSLWATAQERTVLPFSDISAEVMTAAIHQIIDRCDLVVTHAAPQPEWASYAKTSRTPLLSLEFHHPLGPSEGF